MGGTNGASTNGSSGEPTMRWDIPEDDTEADGMDELSEAVARHMEALENAEWTTHFARLERAGIELPPPEALDDDALTAKLWEVIEALAELRVYLHSTDHLSDRELYAQLWGDALREDVPDVEPMEGSSWHIDLVSGGGPEDIRLWLTYYADDEDRAGWAEQFPDEPLPERETPPYDRDSRLPEASFFPPDEEEF